MYHFNIEIKMNCYLNFLVYPRNRHFDENSKRKNSINQEKNHKDMVTKLRCLLLNSSNSSKIAYYWSVKTQKPILSEAGRLFKPTLSSSIQVTGSLLERNGISPQILLFQPGL